jgi:hypothetical protein
MKLAARHKGTTRTPITANAVALLNSSKDHLARDCEYSLWNDPDFWSLCSLLADICQEQSSLAKQREMLLCAISENPS